MTRGLLILSSSAQFFHAAIEQADHGSRVRSMRQLPRQSASSQVVQFYHSLLVGRQSPHGSR